MITIEKVHKIIRTIYGRPDRFFSFPDRNDFLSLKDTFLADKIINPLNRGDYEFSPFSDFYVPKENGKHRIVYQATRLKDEIVLIYLHQYLLEKTGPALPEYIIGYRKKKDNPAGILNAVRSVIAFSNGQLGKWAIKADIRSYYESIDKERMIEIIDNAKKNYNLDDSATVTIKRLIRFPGSGLPTGLSPVNDLANLYLLSFDRYAKQKAINYYRYGDDIILISEDRPQEILEKIGGELANYGLSLSPQKTKLLSPNDSFDYIGFSFKKGEINFKGATIRRIKRRALKIINKPVYRKLSLSRLGNNRYLFSFFFYEIAGLLTEGTIKSRMKYFVLIGDDRPFRKIDDWFVSHIRRKLAGSWSKKTIHTIPYRIFSEFGFISSNCLFHKMERAYRLKGKLFDRIFSPKEMEKIFLHYFKPPIASLEWKTYFINRKENSLKLSQLVKEGGVQFSETRLISGHNKPIIAHSIGEKIVLRGVHLYLKKIYYSQLLAASSCIYGKIGSAVRLMRLFYDQGNRYRLLRIDLDQVHERLDRQIIWDIFKNVPVSREVEKIIISFFGRLAKMSVSGLPRGTPINNIFIEAYLSLIGSYLRPISAAFVRTVDDFLIIYDKNNDSFLRQLELYLKKINMIRDEKRFCAAIGFRNYAVEYLGYLFNKEGDRPLLITIDRYNVNKFKRKIARLTAKNRKRSLPQIVNGINRLICVPNRQYSFIRYYARINDFRLIGRLDDYICDRIRIAVFKRFHLKDRGRLTNRELHKKYRLADLIKITVDAKKIIATKRVLSYIGNTDPRSAPKARALRT